VASGGVMCGRCAAATPGALAVSPAGLQALRWLRICSWPEAMAAVLPPIESELRQLLDVHVAHLSGQAARASRFLREVDKLVGGPP
jgi:hypothetical protein